MNNLPGLYVSTEWLQYSDGYKHNYWEDWEAHAYWRKWQGDLPDSDTPLSHDTETFELPQEYLL